MQRAPAFWEHVLPNSAPFFVQNTPCCVVNRHGIPDGGLPLAAWSAHASELQRDNSRAETDVELESAYLKELHGQKDELMQRVGGLKADLQEWRRKLDGQVTSYKSEVVRLRSELNGEVDALKAEFQELRAALRQQLELTAALAKVGRARVCVCVCVDVWLRVRVCTWCVGRGRRKTARAARDCRISSRGRGGP
ncbi:MAG: hypothetical protein J3K34DRAFT_213472 [Monoraphidium minutum]|nr:MAG: hypothetical protein J3K34DRAFT_213472 [Monoraphidium minutum]